jgi:hypothetical protein
MEIMPYSERLVHTIYWGVNGLEAGKIECYEAGKPESYKAKNQKIGIRKEKRGRKTESQKRRSVCSSSVIRHPISDFSPLIFDLLPFAFCLGP